MRNARDKCRHSLSAPDQGPRSVLLPAVPRSIESHWGAVRGVLLRAEEHPTGVLERPTVILNFSHCGACAGPANPRYFQYQWRTLEIIAVAVRADALADAYAR